MLQNYGSAGVPLHFFIFDLLVLNGKDVMDEPLAKRRELLKKLRSASTFPAIRAMAPLRMLR